MDMLSHFFLSPAFLSGDEISAILNIQTDFSQQLGIRKGIHMTAPNLQDLPFMLYADPEGRIYEHPYLRMAGFSGSHHALIESEDLMVMPEFSKLFYIPSCPPLGLDPQTGRLETIYEMDMEGIPTSCYAVAVFLEPGFVRTHLPAADYNKKSFVLPSWAYGAVGFMDDQYWAAAFEVEYNERWDPRHYDDRDLVPAISDFKEKNPGGPLVNHLTTCATENHCFAAKNLFLQRWEAPLPVSRKCNAACLGCLSLQPGASFEASHERIRFTPSVDEIVNLAVTHLNHAPEGIVRLGLYTMINYLVFPGISDQTAEVAALTALISKADVNFLHLKNLCIDPAFYLEKMPCIGGKSIGMRNMADYLKDRFPDLELGYFNQPVR